MAWENVALPIETGVVNDASLWTLSDSVYQQQSPYGITLNPFETYSEAFQNNWLFGDETFGIRQYQGSTSNGYRFYPKSPSSSEAPYKNGMSSGLSNVSGITICCGYNPSDGQGTVIFYYSYVYNSRTYYTIVVCRNLNYFCQYAYNNPPITYHWQSVPSISGKNGILSLVTLDSESINDGEPVSGAAVSVFDQNPVSGNNVKDIVDGNTPLIPSAVDVTAAFIISNPPVGELASRILAVKKDSIPESIEDADKTVSISANASNVTMPGLDENSQYYFAIFVADAVGDTAVSDPKDIYTSADEGWTFDYTGEIQTFVAPKTGIYSLETWGAQGGDATDGTNSARGGYGAYAVGEVLLNQGDILYINVGGQNGYGGGGNYIAPYIEIEPSILDNNIFVSSQSDAGYSPASYGANYYITLFPDTVSHFDNAKCILTGQQNKSAYTHTTDGQGNDIMSYSNNNTYSISVLAIPLGDLYDVSKIAFSYKIDTSGYEYKFINMWTANIDTSTGSVIESVSIFADNESKSWTDTEVNVNKQMNYLIVQTCNGQNALKDIKVYL